MLVLIGLGGCNAVEDRKIDAEKRNTFYETLVVDKYIVEFEEPGWLWSLLHSNKNETKFYLVIAYQGKAFDKFVNQEEYNSIQENDIYVISQYYWEFLEELA